MASTMTFQRPCCPMGGDNENSAQPQVGVPAGARERQNSATWRIKFGSTETWLPPQLDKAARPQDASIQRCELCRQPISNEEDFVTNSAGERATHTRCLSVQSPAGRESRLRSASWLRWLSGLLRALAKWIGSLSDRIAPPVAEGCSGTARPSIK